MSESEPCGLGEIDPESVAPALIASDHLGRSVPELLLEVALLDLGVGVYRKARHRLERGATQCYLLS